MTNTDLGACELFISELHRSNLIERGQLESLLEDFLRRNPQPDANSLAEFLIAQGTLSRFQADRILQGKTQGLVLGPYVLTDAIGSGSMGTIHRARSKNDGQWYAVKVLPRRSMWNVRLARRQVRAFSQFSHPAVVPFVDVGTAGGLHYLVWSFVDGESLEAVVRRLGKFDNATTAQVGLLVATGLSLAQANGLFHGLLKPSNLMVGRDGQVRILDFGIGSLLAENEGESLVDTMSTANTLTSGLDCASPESIMEPTNRTPAGDQYSLGCVLYYCLAGRYPFADGSAVEKMMAHQFKQPPPVTDFAPETSTELAVVIDRLMQKRPEDRFATIDEAIEALTPLAPGRPTAALLQGSGQAMTQTPTQPLTVNGLGPSRLVTAPTNPLSPSKLVNPDMLPRSKVGSGSGFKPPSAERRSNPSLQLPTRRSVLAPLAPPVPIPPPAPVHAPVRASVHAPIYPAVNAPAFLESTDFVPTHSAEPASPAGRPMLGPLGMLALGATVAIACFIAVNNLIR